MTMKLEVCLSGASSPGPSPISQAPWNRRFRSAAEVASTPWLVQNLRNPMRFQDVDLLNQAAHEAGYGARYVQLEAGLLKVDCEQSILEGVSVMRERVNCSLEYQGAAPANAYAVMVLLDGAGFRWNGHEPGPNLFVCRPGSDIFITTGGVVDIFSIAIPTLCFERYWHRVSGLHLSSCCLKLGRAELAAVTACLGGCLMEKLDFPIRKDLEGILVSTLMQILASQPGVVGPTDGSADDRHRSMGRVRKFVSYNLDRSFRISDLAGSVHLSERSLERLIRLETGLTPSEYVRSHRLEVARKALRIAAPRKNLVTDVALDSGFCHLGRFSTHFRRHFGLLPSELARLRG